VKTAEKKWYREVLKDAISAFKHRRLGIFVTAIPLATECLESVVEIPVPEGAWKTTLDLSLQVELEGKAFASPITAFSYAARHPFRGELCRLATFFRAKGKLWIMIMGDNHGESSLLIIEAEESRMWPENYIFLAVPKETGPPPSPSCKPT
jgi:hypothetical protein